jgi:uncharacterized protein
MAAGVAVVAMALGLVGTVVPLVPGLPLIWLAALGYGLSEGFGPAGIVAMVVISGLLIAGVAIKYGLAHRSSRASGAPPGTVIFATALGFVGFFVIPVVGFIAGAVAGVLLAERIRLREWGAAWSSTKGVLRAFGIGTLIEVGAGIAMIATWAAWWGLG